MTYCTIDLVKKFAQQSYDKWETTFANNAEYEAFISTILIPKADEFIDNEVGHDFNQHLEQTEYLDGNGKFEISPKHLPILSVSKLYTNDDYMGKGTWTLESADDYVVYDEKIMFEDGFKKGWKNIKLIYSYGYASVPEIVKTVSAQIVINLLRYMIAMKMTSPFITRPGTFGNVELAVPEFEAFPLILRRQLDPFRHVRFETG